MKTCTRCGASAYVDADTYCEHEYHEPPMPSVSPICMVRSEWSGGETLYEAAGPIGDAPNHTVWHPTRDGAIALWQERWTWAPVVRVIAERLLGPQVTIKHGGGRRTISLAGNLPASPGDLLMVGGEMFEVVGSEPPPHLVDEGTDVRARGVRCLCHCDAWIRRDDVGACGSWLCAVCGERVAMTDADYGQTVTIPPNATVTRASATTSRGEPIGVFLGDGPPDEQGRPTSMVLIGGPLTLGRTSARAEKDLAAVLDTLNDRGGVRFEVTFGGEAVEYAVSKTVDGWLLERWPFERPRRSERQGAATFAPLGIGAAIHRALEGRDPFVHEVTDHG